MNDDDDGFVTSPSAPDDDARNSKVYCVDCEMVFTTSGLELARMTIIDEDQSVVRDTFVKPDNTIVDHNTRYSGVEESDLRHVTTRLEDVQKDLLTLLSDKTILIGHSLDCDLNAMKLFHTTVMDTSVAFPPTSGHFKKCALKTLAKKHLGRNIQTGGRHDSLEDAKACFDLAQLKVKTRGLR